MKRTIICLLSVLIALTLLAGCGSAGTSGASDTSDGPAPEEASFDAAPFKTLGEALAVDSETRQSAFSKTEYSYVFEDDGTVYRVIADMPEDISKALWELSMLDEDYNEKLYDLLSPLEVRSCENLSELIPSQEELDELKGKTGAELLDDGWYNTGYILDDMVFYMNHDMFEYLVVFDGRVENTDNLDIKEAIRPLTVKSVTYYGLGDAAGL